MNKNIQFLRNKTIASSKEVAIQTLKTGSFVDNVLDGTLVEARYTDGGETKTVFALYHVSGESKTATIYDSEAHLAGDEKLSARLDKIDGGEDGGEDTPSLIDRVTSVETTIGETKDLVTKHKTDIVGAINETYKKIGTVPVLVDNKLQFKGDYEIDPVNGKISSKANLTEGTEVLVLSFKTIGEDGKTATFEATEIDFEQVVLESELGNGLKTEDHKIAINLDTTTESYLTVSDTGLKLSGLDNKFATKDELSTDYQTKTEADKVYATKTEVESGLNEKVSNSDFSAAKTALEKKIASHKGTTLSDAKLCTKTYSIDTTGKIQLTETPLDKEVFVLVFKTPKENEEGFNYEPFVIDAEQLLLETEAGNGIKVIDHIFQIELDATGENDYLSVSENGLKLTGIKEIEEVTAAALNDLNTRIKTFEVGPTSISTQINQLKSEVDKNRVQGTDKEIKVEYNAEAKANKISLAEDLVIDCGTY